MTDLTKIALLVVVVLFFIFIGPALLLWSVGTMFQGEGLDITFWNWLAAFVFLILMRGETSRS
tara:strand:- start:2880 stop:3068 length:189 start_codon:yes stop_codon:yes gene_type:complete